MEREPAVAGRFYPAQPDRLAAEVARCLAASPAAEPPVRALGAIVPHAGYVYSGAIAGATFARIDVPRRAIVLCPNHTGLGRPAALWADGAWATPLGPVPVDAELVEALEASELVQRDRAAHRFEHALEVELPFLLTRRPDVAIAPLCLGHLDLDACRDVARAVAGAARLGALVVASSDMSHYLPAPEAARRDRLALDRILALDAEGLFEVVHREEITMCGVIPATVMLLAARELGATSAELVRYGHSGLVNGDESSVVGYAGVLVT